MPALVCRQEHWGQEMPMKYAGVRSIRAGQSEAVAAVRMSGSEVVFSFDLVHAEGPILNVREAIDAEKRRITGVTVEGSTLTVHVTDLANLYIGDHVSIDGVPNVEIREIGLPDRVVLDVDAKDTPYWQSVAFSESETMTIDTRRYVLEGVFTFGTVSRGSIVRVGGRLLRVDRFSGIITHETSYLYLNDPGHPSVDSGVDVRLGAPSIRLTAQEDVDWAVVAKNGSIRLKGDVQGTFPLEVTDARSASIRPLANFPLEGQAKAVKEGKIVVERLPTASPPAVGEKIVLAGTHRSVPAGPYTGKASCAYGHADQRGFDGVWTVTKVDGNNVRLGSTVPSTWKRT